MAVTTALMVLGAALTVGILAAFAVRAAPASVDAQRAQVRSLEAEIQDIDAQAGAAADAHAEAVRRADDLRARIARTTRELAATRAARAEALARLSDRLVAIYREEPPTLIELVLSSGDLSAAVDAQQALEVIGAGDKRMVDRLGATRTRLTALAKGLRSDRGAADAEVTATRAHQQELDGLIARRRAVLDDAQSQLDAGLSRARAARRARAAAAAQARGERDLEATLRRRAQAGPGSGATPTAPAAAAATPAPSAAPDSVAAHLARIAQCESGGDPTLANGPYRGKYQFDMGTWQSVGGTGDPAAAPEAEQDRRAAMLYAQRGWAPWPVCQYR